MIARTCEATALDADDAEVMCGAQASVRRGDYALCEECSAEQPPRPVSLRRDERLSYRRAS